MALGVSWLLDVLLRRSWDPERFGNGAEVASVAVLVITGVLIYRQVWLARQSFTEEHRPYVVVSLELDGMMLNLSVTNLGRAVAEEVALKFDPPLVSAVVDYLDEITMVTETIPSLVPGQTLSCELDHVLHRWNEPHSSTMPKRHEVMALYKHDEKAFVERFVLDLWMHHGTAARGDRVDKLGDQVKAIADELRTQRWDQDSARYRASRARSSSLKERLRLAVHVLRGRPL